MGKEITTQVQETQRIPNRINPRQNTPRHILIKLIKIKHKEQILKAAREKQQITHKGIPIRITADLSIDEVAKVLEPQLQHHSFQRNPRADLLRMDWLDLLAVQGTLKSLSNTTVQNHQFFGAQLSL